MLQAPYLITDNKKINDAYRLAVATLAANIMPFQDGILQQPKPVILAGLGYDKPWTRDTAINVWNGGGLIAPEVSLNTLQSVLGQNQKGHFIQGQYWDAIIWTIGAWQYYLYTGDKEFLTMAYDAVKNSLAFFEETEFTKELNLFRGPACYGDGISAYPDIYATQKKDCILLFPEECPDLCENTGVGIPMHALSTNCLYYYAYVLADAMALELGENGQYEAKAQAMKEAINRHFWNEEKQNYRYLVDKFGGCDSVEGLGVSFAVLFGVANQAQKAAVFQNTPVSEYGITCVYPSFSRYDTADGLGLGRHSGTVWPHVQGFWADAAGMNGQVDVFDHELSTQTENALRFFQFAEIYHPVTGEIYGGRQEGGQHGDIVEFFSENHQTWSATAYLRNIYFNLLGMQFQPDGIAFSFAGSKLTHEMKLSHLHYRNAEITLSVNGSGENIQTFTLNGVETEPFIPATVTGKVNVEIQLV